jgi:hypothetical protein
MTEFVLDDGLWQARMTIPVLGLDLKIYIERDDESPPTQRQQDAVDSLQNLPKSLLTEIAEYALAYYRRCDIEEELAEEGIVIDKANIAKHIHYKDVMVPELEQCETNYFFLGADCDWEPDQGMEVLVGDGHVISCGGQTMFPYSPQWIKLMSAPKKERDKVLKQYNP